MEGDLHQTMTAAEEAERAKKLMMDRLAEMQSQVRLLPRSFVASFVHSFVCLFVGAVAFELYFAFAVQPRGSPIAALTQPTTHAAPSCWWELQN